MLLRILLLMMITARAEAMSEEQQNQHEAGVPIRVSCEVGVSIEEMTYHISVRNEGKAIVEVENNLDAGHGLAAIQLVDKETGEVFANKSYPDGWFSFGGPRKGQRRDANEAITKLEPGKGLGGTFRLRWAQSPLSLPLITSDDEFKQWLGRYRFRLRVTVAIVHENQRVEFFYISPWMHDAK